MTTGVEGMAGSEDRASKFQSVAGFPWHAPDQGRPPVAPKDIDKGSSRLQERRELLTRPGPTATVYRQACLISSGGGRCVNHSGGTATACIILSGSGLAGRAAQSLDEVTLRSVMFSGDTETRQRLCVTGSPLEQIQRAEGVPQLRATGKIRAVLSCCRESWRRPLKRLSGLICKHLTQE
jgi:hypothetical protein